MYQPSLKQNQGCNKQGHGSVAERVQTFRPAIQPFGRYFQSGRPCSRTPRIFYPAVFFFFCSVHLLIIYQFSQLYQQQRPVVSYV